MIVFAGHNLLSYLTKLFRYDVSKLTHVYLFDEMYTEEFTKPSLSLYICVRSSQN